MPKRHDSEHFARVNSIITREAYDRLTQACEERERTEIASVPYGVIITEALINYLPPSDPVKNGKPKTRRRKATV